MRADVGKSAIAVVLVESGPRTVAAFPVIKCRTIHKEKVGEAVVVVIEPGYAASSLGLDDVMLFRAAAGEREVNTGLLRDFGKLVETARLSPRRRCTRFTAKVSARR